ncbi:MAG: exonuclease domain-containing protein [Patescibacteria group bacterium]
MFPNKFILLDTEQATKDERSMVTKWSRPGDYQEVIQIGAAEVLGEECIANRYFERLTKPILRPRLSRHIISLTHITQKRMNASGISLAEGLDGLRRFSRAFPIYAFGDDGGVIHANCELVGIRCPLPRERFHDIRPLIAPLLRKLDIDIGRYSSGTLLRAFGLTGSRPHDALNDVRNLVIALQELHIRGRASLCGMVRAC